MKNIQKLMLMTFMMVASSAILQAATTCTIQMKNSTGYTILQSTGSGSNAVVTQIKDGATFNYTATEKPITNAFKTYYAPHGNISLSLLASGGASNYVIPGQDLGQMCPLSSVVFKIKLDENNNIKIAA